MPSVDPFRSIPDRIEDMVSLQKLRPCDYVRFVVSCLLLVFSLVVTCYAIVMQKTGFWPAVPGWAALLLFVIDLIILGIVEGLQIALVELKRQHPESYRVSHPAAYRLGRVAAHGDNTERFLMGRQVCVVVLVFFAAKLTAIDAEAAGGGFLFPTPVWFRVALLETGLIACITVVILAQLMPQIVAAQYPVHFLQMFIMRPFYYICTALEATGLTHATWLLSAALGKICRFHDDDTTTNPNDSVSGSIMDIDEALAAIHDAMERGDEEKEKAPPNGILRESSGDWEDVGEEQAARFTRLAAAVHSALDRDTLRVMSRYLDSHPEQFSRFPYVVGGKVWPAPAALAAKLEADGQRVPAFLSDITDSQHEPPHVAACRLLSRNNDLMMEVNQLKQQVAHTHTHAKSSTTSTGLSDSTTSTVDLSVNT